MNSLKREVVNYSVGLALAAGLTLLAYFIVIEKWVVNYTTLASIVLALAALQMIVQVIFFLHVGQEAKPRWQTHSFVFVVVMMLVIVVGSVWIMNNLDYNMMVPSGGTDNYMLQQNNKGF